MGTIYGLLVMLCFASAHIVSLPRRTSQGMIFVLSPGMFDQRNPRMAVNHRLVSPGSLVLEPGLGAQVCPITKPELSAFGVSQRANTVMSFLAEAGRRVEIEAPRLESRVWQGRTRVPG